MTSAVGICNLALGHLGVGVSIATLTEQSAEAVACNRFYELARDEVLRDFAWPFATKIAELGETATDPNDEWAYSYEYPSDCLEFRRILSGVRNDDRQSKVPYRLAYSATGKAIFADQTDAVGEYTMKVTDPEKFPVDFVVALSYRIASYIAPVLTGGDPYKLGNDCLGKYNLAIANAKAKAKLEEQPEEEPDSEFGRARF